MPKISVAVPHHLVPEKVSEMIRPALEKLMSDFQGGDLKTTTTGNVTDFSLKSMGFTIKGRTEARPQDVLVEVDLPLAAIAFKDMAEKAIRKNVSRALGNPEPE